MAEMTFPRFDFSAMPTVGPAGPDIDTLFAALRNQPQQSLFNMAIPQVAQALGQSGPALEQQVQATRREGQGQVAAAQSRAMARGLTGSDIEESSIRGAETDVENRVTQMRSQFALQTATQLAQSIMQALGFDIQQNQAMYQNLALAIGQELTAKRDREQAEQKAPFFGTATGAGVTNIIGQALPHILKLLMPGGGAATAGAAGGAKAVAGALPSLSGLFGGR